jgi:hypothetical protein
LRRYPKKGLLIPLDKRKLYLIFFIKLHLLALIENNQTSDGIKIPKVLQAYTGFDII